MSLNPISPLGCTRRPSVDTEALLRCAVEMQASDIHLKSSMPPMVRVYGQLVALPGFPAFGAGEVRDIIVSFLDDSRRRRWEVNMELDTAIESEGPGRFRLNAYFDRLGPAAALRLIPPHIPTLEEIGLNPAFKDKFIPSSGLVLVTGAAGVGKSTTLASLLNTILQERSVHALTLEDPIEFVLDPGLGIVSQREVGRHTESFESAFNSALREDPDVILIGELRDAHAIEMALTIAETGHLVLASLHSPDATGTIERILGAIPAERQPQARTQLAGSLRAIISQKLVPRQDKVGRVAAREILVNNQAIAALIRDNRVHQIYGMLEMHGELGMCTMEASLAALHSGRIISTETAVANAMRPDNLRLLDKGGGVRGKKGRAN